MGSLSQEIVDTLLLGAIAGRRHLQDSPILPDVWAAFAAKPDDTLDLLITPYETDPASRVAAALSHRLHAERRKGRTPDWRIAFLNGFVVARLTFPEVIGHLMPMTSWWRTRLDPGADGKAKNRHESLRSLIEGKLKAARTVDEAGGLPILDERGRDREIEQSRELDDSDLRIVRYLLVIGAVRAAGSQRKNFKSFGAFVRAVSPAAVAEMSIQALREIEDKLAPGDDGPQIWSVSLNRPAQTAVQKSIPAIKGDAARSLFNISCAQIGWAVLDTGIDGAHPAFLDKDKKKSRVVATYDFTMIRKILRIDNLFDEDARIDHAKALSARTGQDREVIDRILQRLAEDADAGRSVNWAAVAELVERKQPSQPRDPHGTHVAGIIGADWEEEKNGVVGICPDIRLFDLRVIGGNGEDTEFAVIAALQFIQYLNRRSNFVVIHGVNVSLAIPHNVRNYACGRTPVCDAAEELVASGVVVVAAAGNRGYQRFQLVDGSSFDNYAASSITDPGNAEGVITVGSTHRFWPHTYGVSFFSSRGPTGDGRRKPDLVAPGEKIESTVPQSGSDRMDGTSMAAPHVSGAAALLMARHTEFLRQPARVKAILCSTATDLGREPSFQGAGMVDILRALQSV